MANDSVNHDNQHSGSHPGMLMGRSLGEPLGAGLPSHLTWGGYTGHTPAPFLTLHPRMVHSLSLTLSENKNMHTEQPCSRPVLSEGPSAAMGSSGVGRPRS